MKRGEIWQVDFGITVGNEQQGVRPALILSVDAFNAVKRLVIVVPLTSKTHPAHPHPRVQPPEGGLGLPSALLIEQMRSVSVRRLVKRRGAVSERTMREAEEHVRVLLGLV